MSNLAHPSKRPRESRILVFDTRALLSAYDRNPDKVWRNNQELGLCYIPGATFFELDKIAKSRKDKDRFKAKKCISFIKDHPSYHVSGIEDNPGIPIPREIDRQILNSAIELAGKNRDRVVALVTYDLTKMALVAQSQRFLPNFCMIEAKEIAKWCREGCNKTRLPQAINVAYQGIAQTSGKLPGGNSKNITHSRDNTIDVEVLPSTNQSRKKGRQGKNKSLPPSKTPINRRDNNANARNNNFIASSVVLIILLVLGFLGLYSLNRQQATSEIDPDTGIVVLQEPNIPISEPTPPTPPELLALADNGILDFRRTENSEALLRPINELQKLKNLQGGKLSSNGEEKLSKLKHKYAIEVLASRSQVKKAVELLGEIPITYTDYPSVEAWLAQQ
ncbi:PIN domain-containing protein [Leptothoe sp. ISB3NOV94-8A]